MTEETMREARKDFLVDTLKKLLGQDSPSGFTDNVVTAAASLVMLATCAVTAMPAHAANMAINGPSEVSIKSYLVIGKDANMPDATFTYDVLAGPDQDADANTGKGRIEAGITPDAVTVTDAVFTAGEQATSGTVNAGGTIAPSDDYKYAVKEIKANFSGVSFTQPGVYRYIIKDVTTDVAPGVTCDTHEYYVDIEVRSDDAGILSIGDIGVNDGTSKVTAFVNTFTSASLTLTKNVTGNQGDRNKYFEFEVKLENAPVNSIYTVTYPAADNHSSNTGNMTVGEDGTVTKTVYLKDDQSITINGLTANTKYTIAETDYSAEGYTTTNDVGTGATTGQKTMTTDAASVTFTNNKEGTVPTGILLDVAPYIVLVALVGVGLIALLATKKRRSR